MTSPLTGVSITQLWDVSPGPLGSALGPRPCSVSVLASVSRARAGSTG